MFIVRCDCHAAIETASTQFNQPLHCSECGREIVCVSAEAIDDISAAADFDAALLVVAGPTREAQLIELGGCAEITLGSDAGNHIVLRGEGVGPSHCKLVRIDFGPSQWQIQDLGSAGGVLVNEERAESRELQPGDTIQIGEYELRYHLAPAETPLAGELDDVPAASPPGSGRPMGAARKAKAPPRIETNGPLCPSCLRRLGHRAKICVECGIRIPSGRPLLTSQGLDENVVYGNAETALKFISWLVWITPLPIPLASEAYGKFKPYAIWMIAALTTIASICFLVARWNDGEAMQGLMLWPSNPNYSQVLDEQMRHEIGPSIQNLIADPHYSEERIREGHDKRNHEHQFHPWQLVTHALLHDPDSVLGFILHLGGNMLFLIVFGSRVNAIIGNAATAILYPLLAIAAGLAYLLTQSPGQLIPLVGASGAINGLAGMYLVLFPAHYVYCAMWIRFNRHFALKIFALRGFWLLLIYFAYDVLMIAMDRQGQTAHWAHIGGFVTGVVIGIVMLMSRLFNCRNGDLLSVVLGKHAWPLIGKPSRWAVKTEAS